MKLDIFSEREATAFASQRFKRALTASPYVCTQNRLDGQKTNFDRRKKFLPQTESQALKAI
jgi:hypothetical protein